MKPATLLLALSLTGCASVQPAARTASKLPGAALVFCSGLILWPVAAWALAPQQEALLWPGWCVGQYWRDAR